MVGPPSLFLSTNITARAAAGNVVSALLTSDAPSSSTPLPPESEGGRARNPPQRDKGDKPKFNIGASLQEQDQLRVLAMLNSNSDCFAFSMEDLEPAKFTGEPVRIALVCVPN